MNGTKSSTVTSTPNSANTSTAAFLEGSSLLQSTPSMSNNTADTFPHSLPEDSWTFFSSTFTQAFTTVVREKIEPLNLHWKLCLGIEMGFSPFELA